ncbi:MAG TPA: LPXTG cell wall anchor domain-containing protein [Jatrophihabitantaceae bacterium]|nr:LPXTG cell wall anchor domain-containing protein [Jatrophihabitantaceae bacterium]
MAQPAQAATSGSACAAATSGAQVHFLTDFGSSSPDGSAIAGVTVDGFDAGACDGLPVTVIITGNAAGSDADPASELLSTLDSTLDPCTGAKLGAAGTIAGGSITLHGCASVHDPSGAAYASMHDATALTVKVADAAVPVTIGGVATSSTPPPTSSTAAPSSGSDGGSGASSSHGVGGVSTSRSGGSNGSSGQSAGGHGLASTGSDIALLTLLGVLLLLGGLLLLQRRRGAREN